MCRVCHAAVAGHGRERKEAADGVVRPRLELELERAVVDADLEAVDEEDAEHNLEGGKVVVGIGDRNRRSDPG